MAWDKNAKREYDRESYAFWKSLRRCKSCHGQDAYTLAGRTLCAECAEKNRIQKAEYREKNRAVCRMTNNEWYRRMKAKHRCVICAGEIPAKDNHTICAGCRARRREKHEARQQERGKLMKRYAKDCGICGICNRRPAMEGKRTCPECYAQNMRNLEKANAARSREAHPWYRLAHAEAVERRAAV